MQWPDLQAFAQVVEELSFSRAADRLHLTTSAVVRRIQRLERDLGCRLLDRSTTHVALTLAGSLLAARLPALTTHWQQVAAAVAGPPLTPRRLRLGLIELCSKMMAEHLVAAMPDVELDWLTDDSAALSAMLARGELDMALLAGFPDGGLALPSGAHVATVLREPIWVQVGLTHRLGHADQLHLADLSRECWVVSPPSQTPHKWETAVLAMFPEARVLATSQLAARKLIDSGQAVAFSSALAKAQSNYRVIPLTGQPELPDRHLHLAWYPQRTGAEAPDRVLVAIRGFYRFQARRVPAYWEWIRRHPERFPGVA